MFQNKISATLSDADKTTVLTSVDGIKTKLPFLVNLRIPERRTARKMGAKSIQYVNLNLKGAQSFPSVLPSTINVAEFNNDVALVNQLSEIRIKVAALLEGIDDTILAAGSDAMVTADTIYSYLKTAAKNDGNVKSLLDQIGKRFEGQGKKKAAQQPDVSKRA